MCIHINDSIAEGSHDLHYFTPISNRHFTSVCISLNCIVELASIFLNYSHRLALKINNLWMLCKCECPWVWYFSDWIVSFGPMEENQYCQRASYVFKRVECIKTAVYFLEQFCQPVCCASTGVACEYGPQPLPIVVVGGRCFWCSHFCFPNKCNCAHWWIVFTTKWSTVFFYTVTDMVTMTTFVCTTICFIIRNWFKFSNRKNVVTTFFVLHFTTVYSPLCNFKPVWLSSAEPKARYFE